MNPVLRSVAPRALLLVLAAVICAALFFYSNTVDGYRFLEKYPPDWSAFGWLRAAGLLVAAMLVFSALCPANEQLRDNDWEALPAGWLPVGLMVLMVSAVAIILWPTMIADYVREGKAVSIFTEVVFLAVLLLLALAAWGARASDRKDVMGVRPVWMILGMMLVVFLILMEEMSWGQHWIGFATPGMFEENLQNETNIHNFYTHRFEAAYYSAAVMAFVVLPFAWPRSVPDFAAGLSVFVPPPAFAVLALPVCGLFYETWNYVFNQVWIYLGLLIAVHLYRRERDADARRKIVIMASALVLSQVVFLLFGHGLRDGHELTEIREIAIPLAFVAYSAILFVRFRRDRAYRADLAHPAE